MKKLFFIVIFFAFSSCLDKKSADENEKILAELQVYKDSESTEESAKQLMEAYIKDVNASDWKQKLGKYFEPSPEMDAFMLEHAAFRTSFPNYKSTIKHMTIDGNKGIVWMNVTANYGVTYTYDNGAEVVKGIEAKNQAISWDEAWYLTTNSAGNFGDDWYYLKDNHKILEDLR